MAFNYFADRSLNMSSVFPERKRTSFLKPILSYFNILSSKAKALLEHEPPEWYGTVLLHHELVQDFLTLFGYSEGGFEIATTNEQSLILDDYVIKTNDCAYGYHKFIPRSFEPSQPDAITLGHGGKLCLVNNGIYTKTKEYLDKTTDTYLLSSEYTSIRFFNLKNNTLTVKRVKKSGIHLFYFFNDRNCVLRESNKNSYRIRTVSTILFHRFKKLLAEKTPSHIPSYIDNLEPKTLMMYLSNPLWRDLNHHLIPNSPDIYKHYLKTSYSTLKYHHARYGSKKLREVFFKTKIKSLQRSATSLERLCLLHALEDKQFPELYKLDVNLKKSLLETVPIGRQPMNSRMPKNLNTLLSLGFSPARLLNELFDFRRAMHYLSDFLFSCQRGEFTPEDAGCNIKKDSLLELHNKASLFYQQKRDKDYFGRVIELTEEEKGYYWTHEDYSFEPVVLTDTLHTLGANLNICVRSYDNRAISKQCTIVAVYKKGIPFACIELDSKQNVVQAKLHRNDSARSDLEFSKVIAAWILKNELNPRTYDL